MQREKDKTKLNGYRLTPAKEALKSPDLYRHKH